MIPLEDTIIATKKIILNKATWPDKILADLYASEVTVCGPYINGLTNRGRDLLLNLCCPTSRKATQGNADSYLGFTKPRKAHLHCLAWLGKPKGNATQPLALRCITLHQGGIPWLEHGIPMYPPIDFDANPYLQRFLNLGLCQNATPPRPWRKKKK